MLAGVVGGTEGNNEGEVPTTASGTLWVLENIHPFFMPYDKQMAGLYFISINNILIVSHRSISVWKAVYES